MSTDASATVADETGLKRALVLVVNAVPLIGVFVFDWKIAPIMLLFWAENVFVGVVQAMKMLALPGDSRVQLAKLSLVPFFCVHYGFFCLVHGFFVLLLFGGAPTGDHSLGGAPEALGRALWAEPSQRWALAALALAYALRFFSQDLPALRKPGLSLPALMHEPYARIVVLHVAIIAGGGLAQTLGSPMPALVLLIALKTAMDLLPDRFKDWMMKRR